MHNYSNVFQRFEEEKARKEEKKARALRKETRALNKMKTASSGRPRGKGKAKAKSPRKQAKQGGVRKKCQILWSSIMIVIILAVMPQRKTVVFARGAAEFMPMMIKQQKTSGWVAIPVIDGITMTV